jgi:hypothetical protein
MIPHNVITERPYRTLIIFFIICTIFYVCTIPLPRVDKLLIGSDGIGYFMYTHSIAIDHDLNFANEYAYFQQKTSGIIGPPILTPTKLAANQYAVGTGVLWLPFFMVAHILSKILNGLGFAVSLDGYSYIYQAAICLGSILYGFLGIVLIYNTIKKFFPRTAIYACLLIWFSTNLIYYQAIEPSMSHMCSLFACALLVSVWINVRPMENIKHWFFIGLAGGLVAMVRQPDVTILILPLLDGLTTKMSISMKIKGLVALIIGFLFLFSFQLATWFMIYGSPFVNGYSYSGQSFFWFSPKIIEVLFSSDHGLFLWHPTLIVAALGFIYLRLVDVKLTVLFVLGFLLQVYLIGSWQAWSQGDAFGGRMFISSMPLLALGLSGVLEWLIKVRQTRLAWIAGFLLLVWNGLFLIQYRLGYIPPHGLISLKQLTVGKFWMIADIMQKVCHHGNIIG